MKILILGGTAFVGKHLVETALARGHELTLFNRGRTQRVPAADGYPGVEQLRGNREGGLDALRGRRWDAVIDTSGYLPQSLRDSAELLAGAVERHHPQAVPRDRVQAIGAAAHPEPPGHRERPYVVLVDDRDDPAEVAREFVRARAMLHCSSAHPACRICTSSIRYPPGSCHIA